MSTHSLPLFAALGAGGAARASDAFGADGGARPLKARLPSEPRHERSAVLLLEALALWYGAALGRCHRCRRLGRALPPRAMGAPAR